MRPRYAIALPLASLLLASSALAQTGAEILAKIDRMEDSTSDSLVRMKMVIADADGKEKIREATVKQKGTIKRIFKFQKPADMKGVGVLALEDDVMYVYMPAFKKVRRLASSAKNDSFMGSDLTYEDMGALTFGETFDVTDVKTEGEFKILTLTPKPGKDSSYAKQVMWVRPSDWAHTRIDYYVKKSGELERRMIRSDIRPDKKGRPVAWMMEVKDLKKGSKTRVEILELKTDNGFADKEFSQRYLKRSR